MEFRLDHNTYNEGSKVAGVMTTSHFGVSNALQISLHLHIRRKLLLWLDPDSLKMYSILVHTSSHFLHNASHLDNSRINLKFYDEHRTPTAHVININSSRTLQDCKIHRYCLKLVKTGSYFLFK